MIDAKEYEFEKANYQEAYEEYAQGATPPPNFRMWSKSPKPC